WPVGRHMNYPAAGRLALNAAAASLYPRECFWPALIRCGRHRDSVSAVSEREIRVCHLQRTEALVKTAEDHRGVRRQRGSDAHLACNPSHRFCADQLATDLGVDRVVRYGRSARERDNPGVAVLVVVDLEFALPAVQDF